MNDYQHILEKLNGFTRKYYTKLLIKGSLLFLALGMLFFLIILAVEYFLWLNSGWRLSLLLIFVGVELFLFYRYIVVSVFYLFRVRRGIDNKQASLIIGKHFPEVNDKLLNLLDLAVDKSRSELLLASIDQRSRNLTVVPFNQAIDFKESLGYVKYLGIPIVIVVAIGLSGNLDSFFGSYKRVVHYNLAYEPPAPFSFRLLTPDLEVLETEEYVVKVVTEGKIRPEEMHIVIDGKEYLLQENNGIFSYVFSPPLVSSGFYFVSNGIKSTEYRLKVLKAPAIQDFRLILHYPDYLHKPSDVLKGTGNATFPEGTLAQWQVIGKNTEEVKWVAKDTVINFKMGSSGFELSKRIYSDVAYQVTTSNLHVRDYEKLDYRFTVIKDAYPSIKVAEVRDSLNPNTVYYSGDATDDYGVVSVRLVCFPVDNVKETTYIPIGTYKTNLVRFYYTFPSGLLLDPDKKYNYFFEVTDNDGIRKGKVAKSEMYGYKRLGDNEVQAKHLVYQESIIQKMDKSLDNFKKQNVALRDINLEQRQKGSLSYGDQSEIRSFLDKQRKQEDMMHKFSKQLKENLERDGKDDEMDRLLRERLERQEREAKKNAELLKELEEIAEKLKKDELTEKLEKLAKSQQSNERSLEQILELTKRYYVTEKSAQMARELGSLSKEQDSASSINEIEDSKEVQKKLNEKFNSAAKELDALRKDNGNLRKPLDLGIRPSDDNAVKKDQDDALKGLEERGGNRDSDLGQKLKKNDDVSKKQKGAAQKIQQMSEDLGKASAGGGGSTMVEDAKMLRQILDNILRFSFEQEALYHTIQNFDESLDVNSRIVRKEQELKELFGFVDDSLFSLSLRRPELSDFVNEKIGDVYYNMDKALNSMSENDMYRGAAYQKYVLDASNELTDFLANILDNMEQSLSNSGSGSGRGFQLPDIIRGQGTLKDKLGQSGMSGTEKLGNGGSFGKGDGKKGEGQGGDENGESKGDSGAGKNGGDTEERSRELYNIYKEQDRLRQELEDQLQNMVNDKDRRLGERISKLMQDFQDDLLENGITRQNLDKMNNIEFQLLKLKGAALKQGQKSERESNYSSDTFKNPITTKPSLLENYHNDLEILNREALPLRQNYQILVKDYFKADD
ncbi:hypothetical protein K8352_00460 [Flavobacteriaceae bacterium F89]|uniref:DUF4175 family protein n=1 Tax=Cerina litoralis TaxID=2874477 RepID=A0AAE3JR30_9FLAO|nr:DUF4175 family protein [Cerina litoralis]MCG2459212.1 hypothetical protein [Cerina litoralis]